MCLNVCVPLVQVNYMYILSYSYAVIALNIMRTCVSQCVHVCALEQNCYMHMHRYMRICMTV